MNLSPRAVVLCMSFLTAIADSSTAQAQALIDKVKAVIATDTPRLEATFKDLHGHPELAFTETRTAGIVAAELRKLGFTVTTGIGKTGVVGVLKNGPGPTLWYRADMDANGGVRETTELPLGRNEAADAG
jgi:hippurate hydrolase